MRIAVSNVYHLQLLFFRTNIEISKYIAKFKASGAPMFENTYIKT